jgi:hypothetical protein
MAGIDGINFDSVFRTGGEAVSKFPILHSHLPPEEPNSAKSCNKKKYRKNPLFKPLF